MKRFAHCRECGAPLDEDDKRQGLCPHDQDMADDYHRYDLLCDEGHSPFAARLMAGLSDPEEPPCPF